MDGWMRPAIVLGVVFALIALNVLEFRGKRRQDQNEIAQINAEASLNAYFLKKQYLLTQNIEQLLHMISTILFAILITLLWN